MKRSILWGGFLLIGLLSPALFAGVLPGKCPSHLSNLTPKTQSISPQPSDVLAVIGPRILARAGYRDITRLGAGAFGSVFSAQEPIPWYRLPFRNESQPVILKIFHSDSEEGVYESQVGNYLHSTVVGFAPVSFTTHSHKGLRWNVLKTRFIPSSPGSSDPAPTLSYFLKTQANQLTPQWKERVRWELRKKLQLVHDARVMHGDLKPDNILISHDARGNPQVHLIDWGLSHAEELGNNPLFKPGHAFGTRAFMGIERFILSPHTTHDLFSLRMTEWYLREAGRKPPGITTIRSSALSLSKSQQADAFFQPVLALDEEGATHSRIQAYAEWSSIPGTFAEREAFIERARILNEGDFLKEVGIHLRKWADEDSKCPDSYTRVALEVLSSHLLTDELGYNLGLTTSEIDGIGKSVAHLYRTYEEVRQRKRLPLWPEPAPELLYDRFIQNWRFIPASRRSYTWEQLKEAVDSP
jgi:serine/threonine protein kinase